MRALTGNVGSSVRFNGPVTPLALASNLISPSAAKLDRNAFRLKLSSGITIVRLMESQWYFSESLLAEADFFGFVGLDRLCERCTKIDLRDADSLEDGRS